MRSGLKVAAILAAMLATAPVAAQPEVNAKADNIHDRILVLDSHTDVLIPSTPSFYALPDGGSRTDLTHLKAGGVDAVVMAVAVGPGPRDAAGVAAARREADEKLSKINQFITDNARDVGVALSASDVERLHKRGKIAVIIGFQNARSIGSDLSQIDVFYRAGVRVFAFNHAGHNDFSDSSRPGEGPPAEHGGLSSVGREAVKKLNDLGVLIDVTQLSSSALEQTLKLTRAPVAATHSAARAIVDNTRNLTDSELDAIKANGGVVQLPPFSGYIHPPTADDLEKTRVLRIKHGLPAKFKHPADDLGTISKESAAAFISQFPATQSQGTLKEYIAAIDYVAKRIGWQHVGIGSDFNHGAGVPGFDSEADARNVTRELVKLGYDKRQIAAIWGGNFLRVMRAAEAARAR